MAFRETITTAAKFDFLHKKQSGGSGQYARVVGELIPMEGDEVRVYMACVESVHCVCVCVCVCVESIDCVR